MKLKHSALTASAIVFCAMLLIALPARTYQFFTVLEPVTGFYKERNFSVGFLFGLIGAAIAAFVVIAFVLRKSIGYVTSFKRRPGQAILSFVVAASLLFDAAICYNVSAGGLSMALTTADFTSVVRTPIAQKIFLIQAIFAVISAVFFVASGLSYLSGKSNASEFKILSLSPELWCVSRMIYRFTREISYTRVSDLLFELIMLAFMLLFFMAYAQVNSNVEGKGIEWKLAGYGLPAALMALLCFVPRFIVTVTGNTELLYAQSAAEYCDFAIALFIICVVFTRLGVKETSAVETKAEESVIAEPAAAQEAEPLPESGVEDNGEGFASDEQPEPEAAQPESQE